MPVPSGEFEASPGAVTRRPARPLASMPRHQMSPVTHDTMVGDSDVDGEEDQAHPGFGGVGSPRAEQHLYPHERCNHLHLPTCAPPPPPPPPSQADLAAAAASTETALSSQAPAALMAIVSTIERRVRAWG